MAYIGPLPAETFTSFATQEFSTSATTSYTLDHPVTNENELALFINNVRQQPGSGKAYTASGTALTLSAATASTDTMYAVFLGRALQTVNPADASVGTSQLAATSVTAAKLNNDIISGLTALAETPADTDELLLSDGGTIKRIDFSHLKSSAGLTPLSTSNITSGVDNVTFSSPFSSTYDAYKLIFTGVTIATDNQNLQFQHIDSGGTTQTSNYYYANEGRKSDGTTTAGNDTTGAAIELTTNGIGNASDESVSGCIMIYKPLATDIHKIIQYETAYMRPDGHADRIDGAGFWSGGTASMSGGFLIKSSSGQIDGGRFTLYGLAHS